MKSLVKGIALLCVALSISQVAYAGAKGSVSVYVSDSGGFRFASGNMGTARNSTDHFQEIACQISASSGNSTVSAYCYAVDAQGNLGRCSTSESQLVGVAESIKGDSYVDFSWDANYNCTSIGVIQNSAWEPKNP